MTNSGSPFLTSAPSLNGARSMNPLTRACTLTVSIAARRPGYSSHSVTSRTIGRLTETAGGGGGTGAARRRQPDNVNKMLSTATAQARMNSFPCVGPLLIGGARRQEAGKSQRESSESLTMGETRETNKAPNTMVWSLVRFLFGADCLGSGG